jgi:hypothetical protein
VISYPLKERAMNERLLRSKWAVMLGCWVAIQVLAIFPASAWNGVPVLAAVTLMLWVLALSVREAWQERRAER